MMGKELVLALDVGSSSARCSAYGVCQGDLICETRAVRKARLVQPISGAVKVDTVMECIDECIDEVIANLRHGTEFKVIALGFSTFVMNMVGVDEQGKPVGQDATISYACNSEGVNKEVQTIKTDLGESEVEAIYRKTGTPIHAAYALAQLRVLYASRPHLCGTIRKWQTVSSLYLAKLLNLKYVPISYSEASWTGLLNYQLCEYEPTAVDLLPPNCISALPELADFDEPNILQNGLPDNSPYASKWPELGSCRFFLGLGDGACANIGSKCHAADKIACTIGTSAAARLCLPLAKGSREINIAPGLFCYRVTQRLILVGGALTDGGSAVEWVSQLLNLQSKDDFQSCLAEVGELIEEELATAAAQNPSLVFVPFLSGERSTGFRSGATGAMLGLTRETTQAHLFKAVLEGVTLRLRAVIKLILEEVTPSGEQLTRIIVSGSALESNTLWRQMLADCTGLEVVLDPTAQEGTSLGVAYLIGKKIGLDHATTNEGIASLRVSRPRAAGKAYWDQAVSSQEAMITAIEPLFGDSR